MNEIQLGSSVLIAPNMDGSTMEQYLVQQLDKTTLRKLQKRPSLKLETSKRRRGQHNGGMHDNDDDDDGDDDDDDEDNDDDDDDEV
uniref:Uncharacterized protein n=1 Tax=Glossina morsitans morsitans TaxID=37546 RepID=A0A1B0G3H8_GLOMM